MSDSPRLSREFVSFLLVGGFAAAAQWLSRFGFNLIMPYAGAVGAAYLVGLVIAFELNRRYVFPQGRDRGSERFARFILVNAASFVMVWTVSMVLGQLFLPRVMPETWALATGHAVGILSPVLLSYILHKHFTFRATAPSERQRRK